MALALAMDTDTGADVALIARLDGFVQTTVRDPTPAETEAGNDKLLTALPLVEARAVSLMS